GRRACERLAGAGRHERFPLRLVPLLDWPALVPAATECMRILQAGRYGFLGFAGLETPKRAVPPKRSVDAGSSRVGESHRLNDRREDRWPTRSGVPMPGWLP